MEENLTAYLSPTSIIDSDNPAIQRYARKIVEGTSNKIDQAVKLYLAVRDGIRYDPYAPFYLPLHYKASYVLERGKSFCVPKASLLCALGRACDIPTRVGFATVRNHLATKQLLDYLGSNIFVYHGFVDFLLDGKWVKATPAFNRELCDRHGVPPLEFNGRDDSLFHPFNSKNERYMEYIEYTGTYADIPVSDILAAWKRAYGEERVKRWIDALKHQGDESTSNFDNETVWKS
jgi:transglutaminase-like putative cysteine protease